MDVQSSHFKSQDAEDTLTRNLLAFWPKEDRISLEIDKVDKVMKATSYLQLREHQVASSRNGQSDTCSFLNFPDTCTSSLPSFCFTERTSDAA